jgi:ectoine hydroxylase-related dioxygenase (phytanoyl-CoA dioxygenase family)
MQPGDALIFDLRVLHGSGQNRSLTTPRRAVVFRFAGDDARYAPQPNTMPIFYRHGLHAGDPLSGPLFPQLLPYGRQAERRPRDDGHLPFDWRVGLRTAAAQIQVELRRLLQPSRYRRSP